MISFCHGQEHSATNHKHFVVVSSNPAISNNQLGLRDGEEVNSGDRFEFNTQGLEIIGWFLEPEYDKTAAIRRLIRSIDGIVLHYLGGDHIEIEKWMDRYTPDNSMIMSIVRNFGDLERMNMLFGTLTSQSSWKKGLLKILTS